MTGIKGDRLYVKLGASQTRRRLKGLGFGVRKVEHITLIIRIIIKIIFLIKMACRDAECISGKVCRASALPAII